MMTLRLLEHWRFHLGLDTSSALVVLATASITMEKFTRTDLEPDLRNIRHAMPPERLTKCNIASIAAATGIGRESARRKVHALMAAGILMRSDDGALRLSPDYTRLVPTDAMLRAHLETLVSSTNDFLRDNIVRGVAA
jgi:hypothetical protein